MASSVMCALITLAFMLDAAPLAATAKAAGSGDGRHPRRSRQQPFGSCPVEERSAITGKERLVIPQKVNYAHRLRLFQGVAANTLAQKFKRSGNHDPTLPAVTATSTIVNESRHSPKLGIGEGSCFPYIASTTPETAVILREKLQKLYRGIVNDGYPWLDRYLV
jgi:hypothetical protein